MKSTPPVKRHVRAYIRTTSHAGRQTRAAQLAGAAATYRDDQRARWFADLRPGEVGWVWRLSLLAVPRGGDVKPGVDWGWVCHQIGEAVERGVLVIEGESAITSQHKRWPAAIQEASRQVLAVRTLTTARARELGAKGAKRRHERSAARIYKALPADLQKRVRALWRSAEYENYAERAEAINKLCEDAGRPRLGSGTTLWRLLRAK